MSIMNLAASLYVSTANALIDRVVEDGPIDLTVYMECQTAPHIRNWMHNLYLINQQSYNRKYRHHGEWGLTTRKECARILHLCAPISMVQAYTNLVCINYQCEEYRDSPAVRLLESTITEVQAITGDKTAQWGYFDQGAEEALHAAFMTSVRESASG